EDVFSDLVRATNSQTKVDETQFISLRPIVKRIESYFNTYKGQDGRIFFERRERQYIGKDVPSISGYYGSVCATRFGVTVPPVPVQTVPGFETGFRFDLCH